MEQALKDIRVLDLSRVLAGPYCTQMLGDMGAEIIKIERPGQGDDTRQWGPPYLSDKSGQETGESAYYLSCNRNKKSAAIDIADERGQALIHGLLERTDILIENFKTGGLKKYGLAYEQLKERYPALIYCSITGFGQTGPLAAEPGYDFLAQGASGLMAHTGAPGAEPMKSGVAMSDILTGQNAAIGILAALQARTHSGLGQHVDVALLDCTLAAMTNLAQYYLTSGTPAPRIGNAHATIVPYQVFEAADEHFILAVGNNSQFAKFCTLAGHPQWASDPRFAHNRDRVKNREVLSTLIAGVLARHPAAHWLELCREADVPAGPINTMDKVFASEQVQARAMEIQMNHPLSPEPLSLVGSPLKLSGTPVSYDLPPPVCGQHTVEVLREILKLSETDIRDLAEACVIEINDPAKISA
ncbi:MAG: CoA transferase [Alphaproteobacteria bacterium]|nr:CoA transferase [Alphaproteobacteria bacterium]